MTWVDRRTIKMSQLPESWDLLIRSSGIQHREEEENHFSQNAGSWAMSVAFAVPNVQPGIGCRGTMGGLGSKRRGGWEVIQEERSPVQVGQQGLFDQNVIV